MYNDILKENGDICSLIFILKFSQHIFRWLKNEFEIDHTNVSYKVMKKLKD